MSAINTPAAIFNPAARDIEDVLRLMKQRGTKLESCGMQVSAGCDLCNLGDGRLVKSGHRVSVAEAQAMLVVRTRTWIPVPEVFMVFLHNGTVHIVMSLVKGVSLQDAIFQRLISRQQLHTIIMQLYSVMNAIQRLGRWSSPFQTGFGSWPAGPYNNTYFCESYPTNVFSSEHQFQSHWIQLAKDAENYCDFPIARPLQDYVQTNAGRLNSQPRLCHGDLTPRNILVDGGRITAILDWETVGWYPPFWEMMGLRNAIITRDLEEELRSIFGADPKIASIYRKLLRDLDHPEVQNGRIIAAMQRESLTSPRARS